MLAELGEEGDEAGELDVAKIIDAWRQSPGSVAFLAKPPTDGVVGGMTVSETFAIYGVINEMYGAPAFRANGIGKRLIEAARHVGEERGWHRIDVTAPESNRWLRTRRFYEKNGFVFTGPKLKLLIG